MLKINFKLIKELSFKKNYNLKEELKIVDNDINTKNCLIKINPDSDPNSNYALYSNPDPDPDSDPDSNYALYSNHDSDSDPNYALYSNPDSDPYEEKNIIFKSSDIENEIIDLIKSHMDLFLIPISKFTKILEIVSNNYDNIFKNIIHIPEVFIENLVNFHIL